MSEEEERREDRPTSEIYMAHPICFDIYEVMQKINEANIHTTTPKEIEDQVTELTEKDCDQILFNLQALEAMLDSSINKLKAMKAIAELRRISVENAVDELNLTLDSRERRKNDDDDEEPPHPQFSPEDITGMMMAQD